MNLHTKGPGALLMPCPGDTVFILHSPTKTEHGHFLKISLPVDQKCNYFVFLTTEAEFHLHYIFEKTICDFLNFAIDGLFL